MSEPRKIKDLSGQIGFNDGMDDEPTPSEETECEPGQLRPAVEKLRSIWAEADDMVREEREACARVVDTYVERGDWYHNGSGRARMLKLAAAIRARGDK